MIKTKKMSKTGEQVIDVMNEELSKEQTGLSFELDNIMSSNKAFRTTLAQSVVQDVREGSLDATQVLIYASKADEFFKSIIDNVRPIVAGKQIQKGGLSLYDTEILEKKNPDKYDFTVCEDSEWDELSATIKDASAKIKVRETFLKSLTSPMATMDGEIINPPSVTVNGMTIAITLK